MVKKGTAPSLVVACRAAGFAALGVTVSRGQASRILEDLRCQDEGSHVPALEAVVARLAKGGYAPSAEDGSFARRAGQAVMRESQRDRVLDLRCGGDGEGEEWGDSEEDDSSQRGSRPGC